MALSLFNIIEIRASIERLGNELASSVLAKDAQVLDKAQQLEGCVRAVLKHLTEELQEIAESSESGRSLVFSALEAVELKYTSICKEVAELGFEHLRPFDKF